MLQLLTSQVQVVFRAANCNSGLEMQVAVPFKYQGSLDVGVKIQQGNRHSGVVAGINNNQHVQVSMGISRYPHRI